MSPRRAAPILPAEKVMAVAAIYQSLIEEIPEPLYFTDARVQAALIDASVSIAMMTDTTDLGLMGIRAKRQRDALAREDDAVHP